MRNALYYRLKPLIPQSARYGIRRMLAKRQRRLAFERWPISPRSAEPPNHWPGWPQGRRFALVLTHDVESFAGVQRVQQLAELEQKMGFRSSFNFIPEGGYRTPPALRHWLTNSGFEVGVHDYEHNGRLYESYNAFHKKAALINKCLKEWNAVGFRSGFMMRNLEWLNELNITYDASTFDTDPFEPEPSGFNTIFPFWVFSSSNRKSDFTNAGRSDSTKNEAQRNKPNGYLELSYTLPQDSTLFLFLREKNIEIWKKKLDWIAEKGGMALLNVHPDYLNFDGCPSCSPEYPSAFYSEFLNYVKTRYMREYWNALPKEVASYCAKVQPIRADTSEKNIAMLAYTDYSGDARVVRYAETLARRGDRVDVIACGGNEVEPKSIPYPGVNLFQLFYRKRDHQAGPVGHLWPLLVFFTKAAVFISRRHFQRPYDLIHVHNIPEWLVFAAVVPRLFGARIILDIHDLVPELYAAKFRNNNGWIVGRLLLMFEKYSCWFSDHVIISNDLWKERIVARSVDTLKCSVFLNNIDPELFSLRSRTRHDDRKIVLFPGTLQWHQGVDIAIRAFPTVVANVPRAEFHIYGGRGVVDDLKALVVELGLQSTVRFYEGVPVKEIPQLMANADLGIVPKRADTFGNEAYSTKIMEFMSQGIPVVISRTAVDSYYFKEREVRFCESGNIQSFAEGMIEVLTDQSMRNSQVRCALEYVSCNHWGTRRQDYLDLVDRTVSGAEGLLRVPRDLVDEARLGIKKNCGDASLEKGFNLVEKGQN